MLAARTNDPKTESSGKSGASSRVSWQQIFDPAEQFLNEVAESLLEQVNNFEPEISSYARYALASQGKQLRPILVYYSAEATGGYSRQHVTIATIIEMIHLATLVHDDILDQAKIRRGRPTLAANWGNEISVLLGDCLFAQALKLAASFKTTAVCHSVSESTNIVCSGEILQTLRRKNFQTSRTEYFRILSMKTAELFALACRLGGMQENEVSSPHTEALVKYGTAMGTAYQVYDDCVDLFGTETTTGKSLGTDMANGKVTLPLLITFEQSSIEQRERLTGLILDWKPQYLASLLTLLEQQNALEQSRACISQLLDQALAPLEQVPETNGKRGLVDLVEFLRAQVETLKPLKK
jgi:octaprenyl-diphosphate synthase